jgi:cytochrome c-type biogenesis protein CcmH
MSAWTIIAILSCLCLLPLMWAIAPRANASEVSAASADMSHYRAQIGEIERQKTLGGMAEKEAESAKAEAGRRLIASKPGASAVLDANGLRRLTIGLSIILLVAVPTIAASIYARLGQPTLDDVPLSQRRADDPELFKAADLLVDLEAKIMVNPDDGAAHDTLAPIYMRLGRFEDAGKSYKVASRVLGETPDRLSGQAEAIVSAQKGAVTPEARVLFAKVLSIDPANGPARFYGAMALKQEGRKADAAEIWQALWLETPDPGLRRIIAAELREVGSAPPETVTKP